MIILRKQKNYADAAGAAGAGAGFMSKVGTGIKDFWKGTNASGKTVGLGSFGNKAAIIGGAAALTYAGSKMIKNNKEKKAQQAQAQPQAGVVNNQRGY